MGKGCFVLIVSNSKLAVGHLIMILLLAIQIIEDTDEWF